ncbi:MAG: class I SAM-dependent methyltransferase [Lysobacterales bacterium]
MRSWNRIGRGAATSYYYVRGKLASDPLYPGVVAALRGSDAPLLDLGCGIGLLAHALRADGQAMRYAGVDFDADKIVVAKTAANAHLKLAGRDFRDLRPDPRAPFAASSVACSTCCNTCRTRRRNACSATPSPCSFPVRIVVRSSLHDANARSRLADNRRQRHRLDAQRAAAARLPRAFFERRLAGAGLRADFRPLHGRTPFNNWLIVATR